MPDNAPETPPEAAPLPDQADLSPADLARAILGRQIRRPRISSVRRLAEALLAKAGKKKGKKAKKAARADKKVRKLAKIPGQPER